MDTVQDTVTLFEYDAIWPFLKSLSLWVQPNWTLLNKRSEVLEVIIQKTLLELYSQLHGNGLQAASWLKSATEINNCNMLDNRLHNPLISCHTCFHPYKMGELLCESQYDWRLKREADVTMLKNIISKHKLGD